MESDSFAPSGRFVRVIVADSMWVSLESVMVARLVIAMGPPASVKVVLKFAPGWVLSTSSWGVPAVTTVTGSESVGEPTPSNHVTPSRTRSYSRQYGPGVAGGMTMASTRLTELPVVVVPGRLV